MVVDSRTDSRVLTSMNRYFFDFPQIVFKVGMVYFPTYIYVIIIRFFEQTLIYWQPIKSGRDSPLFFLVTADYKIVNKTNIFQNILTFSFLSYKHMFQNIDSRIWH